MIFYFTGTGNSLDVSRKLLKDNEQLISVSDALKKNEFKYELEDNESLGFIFPVYFYSVSLIVKEFISKLEISNISYVYAVITCGGGIASTASQLNKELAKKGIKLNYAKELLMPDNAMLYYGIDSQDNNNELLKTSYEKLELIRSDIDNKVQSKFGNTVVSDLVGILYKHSLSTVMFKVEEDKCVSCGLCAKTCPVDAIEIVNGYPKWVKDKCVKCAGCINKCPKHAIQYGSHTKNRNRYKNPNV